ncbi:Peptidyl-tRNA hydrolase ICT1, mitochondrial [Zancudomyces culisetae]|uniref:Peptidyl-tRNA hydrolase ICT1, mitochondrial n=1 Tax=Zancudomyces culisetae TaxID=1213189 RepID=A0A1R1PF83_ZANCU|nr:Peptidyl-tRNA hydrolase ICT1, mitochondrial [Zancudomyces culisetae]|eukprot:OMH79627.1 Peptidyl-tRNA hydrolase ICT1, mitochondrial [Zancudomyces culisetae]
MDSRLNKNGEVVLFSERTRSQRNNADDCFEKWLQALKEACYVPKDPSKEQVSWQLRDRLLKAHLGIYTTWIAYFIVPVRIATDITLMLGSNLKRNGG